MTAERYAFLADGFRKSFGKNVALQAAAVWAAPGSVTILLGRNGSGKTTLLLCALGIVRADHGHVRVHGRAHTRPRLWRLARDGVFFWPARGLLSKRRSVDWHFDMLRQRLGVQPGPQRPENVRVSELSWGERRLAELAIVSARRPEILLADEPLAGLAPGAQEEVVQQLRSLADEGAAIVLTGHDAQKLLDAGDDVVWMAGGLTNPLGSPSAARSHHQFCREYLGT